MVFHALNGVTDYGGSLSAQGVATFPAMGHNSEFKLRESRLGSRLLTSNLIYNLNFSIMEFTKPTFESEFARRQPLRPQIVRLMREALDKNEVVWEDLTKSNLMDIAEYIKDKVAPNSARTYFAILSAFLSIYIDEGYVPCKNPSAVLKAKKAPSQHVALTEREVELIDNYVPKNNCENDVKIIFMRGCLTGARCSDCETFTMDNIIGNMFRYVSGKTKTEVSLPVHKLLPHYLSEQPKKSHKAAVLIRTIQRICEEVGINEPVQLYVCGKLSKMPKYKAVQMHTSRRTFVTNLALRNVPLPTISKLAGHSSPVMTARYCCIELSSIGDEAMSFFNG